MKKCGRCKNILSEDSFYKNKSKKDGLQTCCKSCEKNYTKKIFCEKCGDSFNISHRNLRERKHKFCPTCLAKFTSERIIAQNIGRKRESIVSTKGYVYVRDMKEKHGYIFKHRKTMAEHIGRELTKLEVVHHVDGDPYNNEIDNLLLTDNKGHADAHSSLDTVAFKLVKDGIIVFDKEKGIYILSATKTCGI